MSSSREHSPHWLHSFQAPTQSLLTLSSDSESPLHSSPVSEDEKDKDPTVGESSIQKSSSVKTPNKKHNPKSSPAKNRKGNKLGEREGSQRDGKLGKQKTSEKPKKPQETRHSALTLSSDSESCPDTSLVREENIHHEELSAQEIGQDPKKEKDEDAVLIDTGGESSLNMASKLKSPKKRLKVDDTKTTKTKGNGQSKRENDDDVEVAEEETTEKQTGPYVSTSRVPLVLSEKVQRLKALVECEGESIDLSGNLGSFGRVVISDTPSGNHEMFLDLKGTIYKTTIVLSITFCVIEAIMNDFIQLKPQSNGYEAETMVEGTLEGFSFDSEDEADKLPNATSNQTDANDGASNKQMERAEGKLRKHLNAFNFHS